MTWINSPTYDIQRPTGQCAVTGRSLEPGETYVAALVEEDLTESAQDEPVGVAVSEPHTGRVAKTEKAGTTKGRGPGFKRVDICLEAWNEGHRPDRLFSHWRSTVPQPHDKKKLFVDDQVLMDLLVRLGDSDQPERLSFRFVLALILMRKKLVRYDGIENRLGNDGQLRQWWILTAKGGQQPIDVLNPKLDDQQIQQVTQQLGQILEAEL